VNFKLSKLNALILLGYKTNTDASILVYKFRPERTGFNMYAEHTPPQLTFLALVPWLLVTPFYSYHQLVKYRVFRVLDSKKSLYGVNL